MFKMKHAAVFTAMLVLLFSPLFSEENSGESEIIYYTKSGDAALDAAMENARTSFKYFWREMSWENRRIVKGHDFSAVKIGFKTDKGGDVPEIEHMWVGDFTYDGTTISGILMNQPEWVSSLKAGDAVSVPFDQLTDWMFTIGGKVYGGYTVQVMRAGMNRKERAGHDEAWGLDFGDPKTVQIFYKSKKRANVTDKECMEQDHPMCINMVESVRKQLSNSKDILKYADESGNSMLHMEALAGNKAIVELLLEFGADKSSKNKHGETPLDLASKMEWSEITSLLQ